MRRCWKRSKTPTSTAPSVWPLTRARPLSWWCCGAGRRFRTVVAPVSSVAESGPWSVVLAMHDLSDLYEAEIARRDFFINASHELRTPLASISAAAETLEVVSKPKDSERFRAIIQSEAERMSQLVEEMLALARLESGLTEPEMEVVGMESLLGDAVESIRPQAEREGLSLSYAGLNGSSETMPETMIVADPELVERAVLNLLHNAVKFTDEGGAIEVLSELGDASDPAPMVWIPRPRHGHRRRARRPGAHFPALLPGGPCQTVGRRGPDSASPSCATSPKCTEARSRSKASPALARPSASACRSPSRADLPRRR